MQYIRTYLCFLVQHIQRVGRHLYVACSVAGYEMLMCVDLSVAAGRAGRGRRCSGRPLRGLPRRRHQTRHGRPQGTRPRSTGRLHRATRHLRRRLQRNYIRANGADSLQSTPFLKWWRLHTDGTKLSYITTIRVQTMHVCAMDIKGV